MFFGSISKRRKPNNQPPICWRNSCFTVLLVLLANSISYSNHSNALDDKQATQTEPESVVFLAPHPFIFPWVTYSEEKGFQGILYETLSEAANRSNVNLRIRGEPIRRIFKSLHDGRADFSLLPLPLPEGLLETGRLYAHAKPLIDANLALYGKKGVHTDNFSILNTKPYRIGTQNLPSINIGDALNQNDHIWINFHSLPALIKAIKTDRVDLILTHGTSVMAEAALLGLAGDIELLYQFQNHGDFSVVWSTRSTTPAQSKTATNFINALDSISCDGTVDKIIQRYWDTLEYQHSDLNNAPVKATFLQSFKAFCPK